LDILFSPFAFFFVCNLATSVSAMKQSRSSTDRKGKAEDQLRRTLNAACERDHLVESSVAELDIYSYDATTRLKRGEGIFSSVFAQAVERFEAKETEKLMKEYEFVSAEMGVNNDADDEGFELVDFDNMFYKGGSQSNDLCSE
jgi:hypothetical protein